MKIKPILYWATTSLIAFETFLGGVVDLTHGRTGVVSGPFVTQAGTSLGYPVYILAIIGIFKIPGALTIMIPRFLRLKEWAYAGIVFDLSGAVASLVACGQWGDSIAPLSLLCLAIASWALRPVSRTLGALSPAGDRNGIVRARPLRSDSTTGALDYSARKLERVPTSGADGGK